MGRSIKSELERLCETYQWSLEHPLDLFRQFVQRAAGNSLTAIGSGGSLTSAAYARVLHQSLGFYSNVATPLEYRVSPRSVGRKGSVLFMTASGRNPDVKAAFKEAITREPTQVGAICMRTESAISQVAQKTEFASVFEHAPPCGKDGFLATNSLLATMVLLSRAYDLPHAKEKKLPKLPGRLSTGFTSKIRFAPSDLERDSWIVLHGRWSQPVAFDIESKMSESAMASVQMADYRNFGHGRHHWLASRPESSLVIALVTPEDREIVEKTLANFPASVQVLRLASKHPNQNATIDLLLQVFQLVAQAGEVRDIDPGRPKVANFGRKLYHLNVKVNHDLQTKNKLSARGQSAILRKSNWHSMTPSQRGLWCNAYSDFSSKLSAEKFGALVFDYDETICRSSERTTQPSKAIANEIKRLLQRGVLLGVATGRGKSVGESLCRIVPKKYFRQVTIGYYNGGQIGVLGDASIPDKKSPPTKELKAALKRFTAHPVLSKLAELEARPSQIKIEPTNPIDLQQTVGIVSSIMASLPDLKAVFSGRTIDVIPQCVSKNSLCDFVSDLSSQQGRPSSVLCIGDRGKWPGNDSEMLARQFALSVNEVSTDPATCWNLGKPGSRGVDTMLEYLSFISSSKTNSNHFRIKVPK